GPGPSNGLRSRPPSLCRLRVPDVPMQTPLPVRFLPNHDILHNGSAGSESQLCLTDLMGHLAGHLEIDRLELYALQPDLLRNGRPHLLDIVPAPDKRAVRWKGYGVLCVQGCEALKVPFTRCFLKLPIHGRDLRLTHGVSPPGGAMGHLA